MKGVLSPSIMCREHVALSAYGLIAHSHDVRRGLKAQPALVIEEEKFEDFRRGPGRVSSCSIG